MSATQGITKKNLVKMCGCGEVRELRFRFGPAEKQGREGMQPRSLAKERPASCISMF